MDYFKLKILLSCVYEKSPSTKNIDITSLKSILKDKIKLNDFDALSIHLDEFQKKSYSQLKDKKGEEKIKKSLKKLLKGIDTYV